MNHKKCSVCVGKEDQVICGSLKDLGQCLVEHPKKKFSCLCGKVIVFKKAGYVSKRFGPICRKCHKQISAIHGILENNKPLQKFAQQKLKEYDKGKHREV